MSTFGRVHRTSHTCRVRRSRRRSVGAHAQHLDFHLGDAFRASAGGASQNDEILR